MRSGDVQVAVDVAELDDLVRAAVEYVDDAGVAGADLGPEFADLPAELRVPRARLIQGAGQFAGQFAGAWVVLRRGRLARKSALANFSHQHEYQ